MLVFLITVLVVAALLALDRFYPKLKEPIKYTNLDWEILTRINYGKEYRGRIYSVVKNRIKTVYVTRPFFSKSEAEEFTKKIYKTMRSEYGLANEIELTNRDVYFKRNFSLQGSNNKIYKDERNR